jgi:hypothetical protein
LNRPNLPRFTQSVDDSDELACNGSDNNFMRFPGCAQAVCEGLQCG